MENLSDKVSLDNGVDSHVRRLVEWMAEGIYEKEQLAAMALLCAVAGENVFLLGPPGTAKSLVARRLKGVFSDARSFDYLMSRFSTPDELFGPISIRRLKDNDCYERLTDGYLPSADVVFLDEIWKAGPSIQNTLLTAINEHVYQNGTVTMHLPMKVLIAASNELPAGNEGLEALWDRFLVRMVSNCIADDGNFERMLMAKDGDPQRLDDTLLLTDSVYARWQAASRQTGVSAMIMSVLKHLRHELTKLYGHSQEEGRRLDYYVSDRRWKKAFRLMQTSAFLNGRREMDSSDVILLIHCLWNEPDGREEINRKVANALWHETAAEIFAIIDQLRLLVSPEGGDSGKKAVAFIPDTEYSELYNSYFAIEDFKNAMGLISKWDYNRLSFIDETDGVVFVDNGMRMPVVQIVKNNSVFELNMTSPVVKPQKVKLLKCSGGMVIDGTPYSLVRKGGRRDAKSGALSLPRKREFSALKKRYDSCVDVWNVLRNRIISDAEANIFVSATDVAMMQEEMAVIVTQLAETEIRIKNVAKILV